MTDKETVKVINTLIENITPITNSYYDEKMKLNVQKLDYIIENLIYYLENMTSEHYNSMYTSEEDCRKEELKILNSIKANIEEFLEECK